MFEQFIKDLLIWLTVFAQVGLIVFLICVITKYKPAGIFLRFWQWCKKHLVAFAFTVALVSMLGSLFYSEIAGYTPCNLCWYQRILMYPQVLLLGYALLAEKKDFHLRYLIPLNVLGALLALYHYVLQWLSVNVVVDPSVPCSLIGGACGVSYTFHLGYITIPLMSLTAFLIILTLSIVWIKVGKNKSAKY